MLVEVATAGASEVVGVLLQARASADYAETTLDEKTALHAACEAGQENTAALLISSMSAAGVRRKTRSGGHTAMDILRRSDMNGMARRLEAIFAQTQTQTQTQTETETGTGTVLETEKEPETVEKSSKKM